MASLIPQQSRSAAKRICRRTTDACASPGNPNRDQNPAPGPQSAGALGGRRPSGPPLPEPGDRRARFGGREEPCARPGPARAEGIALRSPRSQAARHPGRPPSLPRGPASHARVGRQRPALAAPADLFHRPGPLPHRLGGGRALLLRGRPAHLQREAREEGLRPGEAAAPPWPPRAAVLTIPPCSAAGSWPAVTAPADAHQSLEAEPQAAPPRHVTWTHVTWPARDPPCGTAQRKLRCPLRPEVRRPGAGLGRGKLEEGTVPTPGGAGGVRTAGWRIIPRSRWRGVISPRSTAPAPRV